MMPLKIVFVLTPAFDPNAGGVQMSTFKIGSELARSGHSVGVFSFAQYGHVGCDFGEFVSSAGPLGVENSVNLKRLKEFVTEFRPDVVINQMPYEHAITAALREAQGFLMVACLRNTLFSVKGDLESYIRKAIPPTFWSLVNNPFGKQLILKNHRRRHRADLRRILQGYDVFVMFGDPNIEELRYFLPDFDEKKIELIPNSIPAVLESVPPKGKRLLWVGRVAESQKRADLIPYLWEKLSRRLPDWELDIVGDGPDLNRVVERMKSMGLQRFSFHGRQKPDSFYSRAAVFFMTSAFEGFPNTLIEAQSFGTVPVIFDSYPMASWIIEHGRSGYLIKSFDLDAMAETIVDIAKADREDIRENALANARRFRIDRVMKSWDRLFSERLPLRLSTVTTSQRHTQ